MATSMSWRSFLVSESVPWHLLGAGVVFAKVVVGVFLFPLGLEELTADIVAGLGLAQVDGLLHHGHSFSFTFLLLN